MYGTGCPANDCETGWSGGKIPGSAKLNERFFTRSIGNDELVEHGIGDPSIVPCQWGVLSCCNAP